MLQGEHSAILQPSLSYHLSLRYLFCLFLTGRFTQVLLYRIQKGLRYYSPARWLTGKSGCGWLNRFMGIAPVICIGRNITSSVFHLFWFAGKTGIMYSKSVIKSCFGIGPDKDSLCTLNCVYFLTHQFKHVFWMLKRTVSLRRLFWVPRTYVLVER